MAALLFLGTVAVASPAPTAGAIASCDGQPATLVGVKGQESLTGTDGPDVIVSNGAKVVNAGKGPDLVCLTGGDATAYLDGPTEYDDTNTWATDRVIGSNGNDKVLSGGGAQDFYDIDQTRSNGDVVSLGAGTSTLNMDGVPTGEIHGGSGRDTLFLYSMGSRVTVAAGSNLRFDQDPAVPLDGIESFHLDNLMVRTIEFTGTAAAESVYTAQGRSSFSQGSGPTTVNASLGGGDDVLSLGPRTKGTVLGGTGRDQFRYVDTDFGFTQVKLAVTRGVVRGSNLTAATASFERLFVNFYGAKVTGDQGSNEIEVLACVLRVHGGAGDDVLRARALPKGNGAPTPQPVVTPRPTWCREAGATTA